MPGRLYVCPIVLETSPEGDSQYPMMATMAGVTYWTAAIGTDATTGRSTRSWALVYAEAANWSAVDSSPQCFNLTADNLDAAPTPRVSNFLVTRNMITRQQINAMPTLRVVCDYLVKQQYPDSSLAAFAPGV